MFHIDIDVKRRLVSITINGMLDDREAASYVAAIRGQFVRTIGAGAYVMMIDTRRCNLQPQSVVETFAKHIAGFPKAERIALVNGNSLARMQLRRILTRDYSRFFDTAEEARAWLLDEKPTGLDCAEPARLAAIG